MRSFRSQVALSSLFRSFMLILFVMLVSGVMTPISASAEPSGNKRIGRLSDGRAYRVDNSGFQLVDQVAELEVNVDELRRELEAVDNELKQKNQTIAALSGGKPLPECPSVSESTIVTSKGMKNAANPKDPPNCNELVSNLYLRVAKLETELQDAKTGRPSALPVAASYSGARCPEAAACDYQSEKNPLWTQVQRLQAELMKGPSAERFSAEQGQRAALEKELTEKTMELARKGKEVTELEEMLADSREEISELREAETVAAAEAAEDRSRAAMAAVKPAASSARSRKEASANIGSMNTPDTSAARKLQQRFKNQLVNIQSLIGMRKDLLDAAKARGKYYEAQPLVTANGTSLDTLRENVSSLNWTSNSATIEDGLKEVTSLLNKDIAAIKQIR